TSFTSYNALTQGAVATFQQVYVRRSPKGPTELVSRNSSGSSTGNAPSLESSISADGTKIAFVTQADDVVAGKTKGIPDIVVRDLSGNSARLVTLNARAGAPAISGNGSTVAFVADGISPPKKAIYKVGTGGGHAGPGDVVADCQTPACTSKPPKPSILPSLSEDGSMISFQSASRFNDTVNSEQAWFGTGNASSPLLMSTRITPPEQAAGGAINPSMSSDGKWVVFETAAGNLVDDDFNGAVDIYLAQVGTAGPASVTRVSVPVSGGEASGFAAAASSAPAVSADGNVIAFESDSSNLVGGDTNGVNDIFVRDRGASKTSRVSVATGGEQANGASFKPGISADGRFVVFESIASNLVGAGADANNVIDVFVHDRQTGETKRVSDNPQQPHASRNVSISANGRFIAFESTGSWGAIPNTRPDVRNVYRFSNPGAGGDGTILMVSTQPPSGNSPSRKAGGRDSFQPSVADDGSVAFLSLAKDLTGVPSDDPPTPPNYQDVFVALASGTVVKVSVSNVPNAEGRPTPAAGDSYRPSISADGRLVAFASDSTNLPDGSDNNPDTDVFVRDINGGRTRLVSGAPAGVAGGASTDPAMNANGSAVAFVSSAPNLVGSDSNGAPDVFLANLGNGGISRISVRPGIEGHQADSASYMPGISGTGLVVAFGSSATNLIDGDGNGAYDVFIRSLTELPSPCTDCRAGSGGPTFSGPGYRFVAADGGIFSFGDAKFHGSAGGTKLARPIVGMASTPSNAGYWLVASDGGIFAYGDAKFHGSTGELKLNSPIVGMLSSGTGMGYWLVASDGGIFSFGDAQFHGSTGNIKLTKPIVGMDRSPSGNRYRFVASDGGIFTFGDAKFLGSMGGKPLPHPIV
ncbi:MAG TPA: hypothetical protein VFS16_16385, partial [Acidimicrobiia bacterium]|nr:hypothetical protein [Acidimicrobiia bacterium]